jgi:hypothetical protein
MMGKEMSLVMLVSTMVEPELDGVYLLSSKDTEGVDPCRRVDGIWYADWLSDGYEWDDFIEIMNGDGDDHYLESLDDHDVMGSVRALSLTDDERSVLLDELGDQAMVHQVMSALRTIGKMREQRRVHDRAYELAHRKPVRRVTAEEADSLATAMRREQEDERRREEIEETHDRFLRCVYNDDYRR